MKIHFASALPQQCFCQGWQDFILRASAFTSAISAKTLTKSKLVRLLPLRHISPKIGSIMCTIQFRLSKVKGHPLFIAACVIVITIHFMHMTKNRIIGKALCYQFSYKQGCVSSSSEVASIQFITEVSKIYINSFCLMSQVLFFFDTSTRTNDKRMKQNQSCLKM